MNERQLFAILSESFLGDASESSRVLKEQCPMTNDIPMTLET